MVLLSQLFLNETMEWPEFQWAIQNAHKNRQGQVRLRKETQSIYTYLIPDYDSDTMKDIEQDMAAHLACDFGGGKAEKLALAKYRQEIWQGRVMKTFTLSACFILETRISALHKLFPLVDDKKIALHQTKKEQNLQEKHRY
ncbi:hypothetical protein Tco_0571018 [Tanacetum coccineum]